MAEKTAHGHKGLRLLLWLVAGLVGLVVIAIAAGAVLLRSDVVGNYVRNRAVPQLSERIGRPVSVGNVDVSVFPTPSAEISDVLVAGPSPDRPLLAAPRAEGRIALWPLIRSFGKEIELSSIELKQPQVNLVRLPDGTWDYQQVLDHLQQTSAPAQPGGTKREVAVGRAILDDGLVRMTDLSAPGGAAVAEVKHIDLDAKNIAVGQRLSMKMRAAVQSEAQNFDAHLSVDPLPANMAALQGGNIPQVKGQAELRDAPIGTLRNLLPEGIADALTGGTVRVQTDIATEGGRYVARGKGSASGLELRGHPADGSLAFAASVDPANRKDLRLDLSQIALKGPGIDLGGTASLQGTDRFQFALAGPLLDMNTLMAALPQQKEAQPAEKKNTLLSPSARQKVAGLVGTGTLHLDRVINGKLTVNDLVAKATLRGGTLTLDEAKAGFYGGTLDASGTTVQLAQATPSWHLKTNLDGMQLADAMQQVSGKAPLSGRLGSQIDLTGAGVNWDAIRDAITGSGAVQLHDGDLTSANLAESVARDLLAGLEKVGYGTTATSSIAGNDTPLHDIQGQFDVRNGWMTLRKPMRIQTPFGLLDVGGRIGLNQQLDLAGTVSIDPPFIAQITGNRLNPPGAVKLPVTVQGTLHDPTIGGITPEAVARELLPTSKVERQVAQEKNKVQQEAKRRLGDILRGG